MNTVSEVTQATTVDEINRIREELGYAPIKERSQNPGPKIQKNSNRKNKQIRKNKKFAKISKKKNRNK